MNQGTSKTVIVFEVAALAALVLFFGVSLWRGGLTDIDMRISESAFTPPVYETGEIGPEITAPLFLPIGADGAIVRNAQSDALISAFKQKVLTRIALEKPLGEQEKSILKAIVVSTPKTSTGVVIVADQTLLRFTEAELASIEAVLTL